MRRLRPLAVLAVLLALLPLTPASAVGSFGATYRIGTSSCNSLVAAVGSDGKTRGFSTCDGAVNRYVEGSGSHWSSSAANFEGAVLAVAIGGTTTYFLLETDAGLYVKSRSATGSLSPARKLSADPNPQGVALTAYGNQWWAVWGEGNGAGGFNLFEAHTLLGTGATRRAYGGATSDVTDAFPAIAYQPSTKTAVIAWTHGRSTSTYSVVRTTSKGGTWGAASGVDATGSGPVLVISGSTVVLVDGHATSGGYVVGTYVGATTGGMSFHPLALTASGPYSVALSSGRIDVAYNHVSSLGVQARIAERTGTTWTEASFSTPAKGTALDTESYGGRARVFFLLESGGIAVRAQ